MRISRREWILRWSHMDHAGTGWVTTGHRRPCYSCYSLHLLLLLLLLLHLLHPHHLLRGAKHCKFQDFVPTSQTPGALKHHQLNISNLFCVSEYFSIFFVKKKISFIIFLDNSKSSFVFENWDRRLPWWGRNPTFFTNTLVCGYVICMVWGKVFKVFITKKFLLTCFLCFPKLDI